MIYPPLILASASLRRQELIRLLQVPFSSLAADVSEIRLPGEHPADFVQRLSREKAMAVATKMPAGIVIGADTIVVLEGEILGKPRDAAQARIMLSQLRGRQHAVLSNLTAINAANGQCQTRLNITSVWMRSYSDSEIATYVKGGDPLDKAGAYAIQSRDFQPVDRLEGCYTNVMGLPLADLASLLKAFGVHLPVDIARICRLHTGQPCCVGQLAGH